jgi:RNA polymerase sigma-70 factor (ECF subfamily)
VSTLALTPRCPDSVTANERTGLARTEALDRFLRGVERRALRMAELTVGDREDALELTQEAMLGFVRRYRDKPESDWAPLFYRVLESRITDHQRRRVVRGRVMSWLRGEPEAGGGAPDPLAQVPDPREPGPQQRAADEQTRAALIAAVRRLPRRQRQVFLLRVWEGLDVADTARALSVGEGSVKTHLSRALGHLREHLEQWR